MATKVVMEALSPTMEEGRLVAWKKKEGDAVKAGETLAEVETDKAVMELVARGDGVLRKVLLAEGATVPVGATVAIVGNVDEDISKLTTGEAERGQAPTAGAERAVRPPVAPAPATPTPAGAERAVRPPEAPAPATPTPAGGRVRSSPLARRLAAEKGLDLKLVQGSGPAGRVVKRDIESATAAAPLTARPPERLVALATAAGFQDVPLTTMRKTIAKRLTESLGPIPHFFLTSEIEMERAHEARQHLKSLGDAYQISFNDLVVKAVALALRQHAAINASFQGDHIRYHGDVHIGMAVAIEDGLITPVIRFADRKGLGAIATESRALAERARARKLAPDEYTGATFSVSNLGMLDIDEFTAVINPPEAAILAVGRIVQKPVVVEGAVVPRRMMRVTLSCDHRVIDGATGARFLQTVKLMLENPLAMLL
ncbi:MAG: pyruvate dehydrogenase complex dihydrolipoamide acetyltransferase [Gemmatimonadetes bacterium]|nr:pyruvate dehydrogenase complex dihydrolipoamide acetyltransferase [Gemmatimonadota bacterium]